MESVSESSQQQKRKLVTHGLEDQKRGEEQPARPRVPAGSELLSGGHIDFALMQTQTSKLLSGLPVHLWVKSRNLGDIEWDQAPP
ncbi:hypothetical protein E5288_WYG012250 [Bos mutus]|uniref:Uncharacterized protein n=1 Tax=Bos mutus TaxID=72004 RepID=A0A6B0RJN3_9CETA|nr:hypothetical protein [Bos mutus]